MITYDTLRELAHALSKVTGYRYIAFRKENTTDLFISFSNIKMRWYPSERYHYGLWGGYLDCQVLDLMDLPNLDWSQCQFDCKEKK